jgi:hypothetical protein
VESLARDSTDDEFEAEAAALFPEEELVGNPVALHWRWVAESLAEMLARELAEGAPVPGDAGHVLRAMASWRRSVLADDEAGT